ncbi:MAG TPA: sugar dehydrogenase complex small subunit [Planctomycetaceae bacterium]|jgi:hypothetical protein|nr:sugar dehydrogenase complex small subunit [Planctomycetaceae bacterium]
MLDDEVKLDKFKALSAGLTGLQLTQLSPGVDPIGLAQQYWNTLQDNLDEQWRADLDAMLDLVKDTAKPADKATVDGVFAKERSASLARSILKLWLLGTWYHPSTPKRAEKVVSSQAYKESLVWKTMQAHPMGYSMSPYGYWAKEPRDLSIFLKFQ